MKRNVFVSMLIALPFLCIASCDQLQLSEDEDEKDSITAEVTTSDAIFVVSKSAVLKGACKITSKEEIKATACFYYATFDGKAEEIKAQGKKIETDHYIIDSEDRFNATISELEPSTQYYYVASVTIKDQEYFSQVKSFTTKKFVEGLPDNVEAVDLGLSVRWATHNVGAETPENSGEYYAWGETETKPFFTQTNYRFFEFDDFSLKVNYIHKYNINSTFGNVDNKTVLDPEDDVAHVKWGGSWRMPTHEEFDELLSNCTLTWTSQNGVEGFIVTSKKTGYERSSIFLPAAGCKYGEDIYSGYIEGGHFYWTCSLYTDYSNGESGESGDENKDSYYISAYSLQPFLEDGEHTYNAIRSNGLLIRPVCP